LAAKGKLPLQIAYLRTVPATSQLFRAGIVLLTLLISNFHHQRNNMIWENKTAVITGAATGIGRATATLLAGRGCRVYNIDVAEGEPNEQVTWIHCDVADRQQLANAIKTVESREQGIDFLFANAGIHLFAGIEETSDEEFDRITGINLRGVYYSLRYVLPIMRRQGKGSIVIMGSDQALVGKGQSAVYGLTKGAVAQLTKSTAIDYARLGIRVNCICPGTIDTPLLESAVRRFQQLSAKSQDEVQHLLNEAQPMGRIGQPAEIARVVVFLLSDESSFMTGALVAADGGYTCQ
jgi:NAD(P)-dependent dehydrogenase (short-subunit alcohol dehydrogenase family)